MLSKQDVQTMLEKIVSRDEPTLGHVYFPNIESVQIEQDGNMTIAVLNGKFIGWSKFNPVDTYPVFRKKMGNYFWEDRSKFSQETGERKAVYRALSKFVKSILENNQG